MSLLLSQPASAAPQAFVMPQLTGLSLPAAFSRTNAAGLRIAAAEEPAPATPTGSAATGSGYHDSFFVGATPSTPAAPASSTYQNAFPVANGAPVATSSASGTVTGQSPPAGHRVVRGESVRLTITH